jgi:thiol-disulfide isomerase/thioredoxin
MGNEVNLTEKQIDKTKNQALYGNDLQKFLTEVNMKPIRLFYLKNCPFCRKALVYIDELKKQEAYKEVEIEMIEESECPEIADRYDYYYVPTFYIDGKKIHEGGIFPDEVEAIFKKALSE